MADAAAAGGSEYNDDDSSIPVVPDIKEILELCQDPLDPNRNNEPFKFFVDKILGCAIGKHSWGKGEKSFKTVMGAGITDNDKAFALLIMENQWDAIFKENGSTKYTGAGTAGTGNK